MLFLIFYIIKKRFYMINVELYFNLSVKLHGCLGESKKRAKRERY